MFPPVPEIGTRVHSPKPPFYETALWLPRGLLFLFFGWVSLFVFVLPFYYPAGRNYYTCSSKTIKSVSVSVIYFVINSEAIQECKCNEDL